MKTNKFKNTIKSLELICTLDSPKLRKSLDIVKKALSKRVPKKVIFEDVGYDFHYNENVYACICPSCGLHILNFTDSDVETSSSDELKEMFHACLVHHAYEGRNNFCNRCGQALDWSDENESN